MHQPAANSGVPKSGINIDRQDEQLERTLHSVDKAMALLAKIRSQAMASMALFYAFLVVYILLMTTVGLTAFSLDGISKQVVAASILPSNVLYFYMHCRVRKKLSAIMEQVKEVYGRHSADEVNYGLKSEHWGGCNKVCA
jgi:hypothetical protein